MQCVNKAYLLIGGNVGDMFAHLQQAIALLNQRCGQVKRSSAVYQTAAWGNEHQPPFLNQALLLETEFAAFDLMPELLLIEQTMGRKRLEKYGPRLIDIDILLFNDEVHDSKDLVTPHPELQNRLFALTPLAEIAGDVIHPVFRKPVTQLLLECKDKLSVVRVRP